MMLNIGEKLDTIAQLLAGAPPGPEEKFLFQKYVYCKEDYTSWVVSLLGDLGIGYTQVDSLVNGLYEYRCECTNDAFNQVILKVELSTNPVLATYKKIDSFSDLIGINVFDMDSYAAGCDSRISKSTTITEETIKYWLNVQNDQIVQRQLDLAGSASIGTYSIDVTGGNVIGGSVPVNGSIRDNILYRKQITDSAFDYTLSNCTIESWIIDYLKNPDDISGDYTEVYSHGAEPIENCYDDDLNTYMYAHVASSNVWTRFLEVSFSLRSISRVHCKFKVAATPDQTGQMRLLLNVDGVWTVTSISGSAGSGGATFYDFDLTGYNLVTGLKIEGRNTVAGRNVYLWVYDISAF